MNFKVVCVNAQGRPNEIPTSKWVAKDETYTVIKADYLNVQNGLLGFKLKEVNIDDCFPYQYFASNRFRPLTEDDANAEKAVKELLKEEVLNY